jgi:hypothetical protein
VQHYFRETFAESQVPAKARMAPTLFGSRRIYEACNKLFSVHYGDGHALTASARDYVGGRISLGKI